MRYDTVIIGTGPAGVSAALNLRIHEKNFLWIGSKGLSDKITKAEQVMNYPGLPRISGKGLMEAFSAQIADMGIEITEGMVNAIYPTGDGYMLAAGSEYYETSTLLLTTGVASRNVLPGEAERLGRGISYCATCDGMLYRGKTVAVLCTNPRFAHEAAFLSGLASRLYFFPTYKDAELPGENAVLMQARIARVEDGLTLTLTDGSTLQVDGLFCLRDAIALNTLLPQLALEDGHIAVDRHMATNLPGCFAAGDCTGRPYQYTKAVGEGNVAAHSILDYLAAHPANSPA